MAPSSLPPDLPGVERVASGKVRDVYSVGDDLLIVATDRISAFDCILPQGIPGKGRVLTQMSLFWFDFLRDVVPEPSDHRRRGRVSRRALHAYRDQLEGRSMLVKRCRMEPIECVARGYVSGSGWKDYQTTGAICGIPLPAGLRESDRCPSRSSRPPRKPKPGHDENISFEAAAKIVGRETAALLRDLTLRIYSKAAAVRRNRAASFSPTPSSNSAGIDGELLLADEVLTPDSSRFWPRDEYAPGGPQKSFDKQFVRDYLETLDWNKQPPAPSLPQT